MDQNEKRAEKPASEADFHTGRAPVLAISTFPRHRLLRQPGGFEGLVGARVDVGADQPPVLDRVEEPHPQRDPRVAAPQTSSPASRHNDVAVARVDDALDFLGPSS
jgi:hypothetical protein